MMSVRAKTGGQAPSRSLDQRMDALQRANQIRSQRAHLKKDLKEGRLSLSEVIATPPEFLSTAKVMDLLMAVPRCGKVRATKYLNHCRIAQGKTVGGLTQRQRDELLELLDR